MGKYLLVGTFTAAAALFVWQSISNAALPWHEMTLREFADPAAVVQAVRAAAPANGVYWAPEGIVAAVSFVPGVADKQSLMGLMLVRQVAIDLLAAFLLALVVARIGGGAKRSAATLGLFGLAAGAIVHLSNWNWYGFSAAFELVNLIDLALNGVIAGLVLGWLHARSRAAATPAQAAPVHAGA